MLAGSDAGPHKDMGDRYRRRGLMYTCPCVSLVFFLYIDTQQ